MISIGGGTVSDFPERIRRIFSPEGLLGQAANFEQRNEQQEMAVSVALALVDEKHLVVEAGTGVGKSLAYLIPAVLWAKEKGKKAIISTQTINLQEQLVYKDIPIVRKVLADLIGEDGFTAMLWAHASEASDVVALLTARGAALTTRDERGIRIRRMRLNDFGERVVELRPLDRLDEIRREPEALHSRRVAAPADTGEQHGARFAEFGGHMHAPSELFAV